jgi:hypothetical protein
MDTQHDDYDRLAPLLAYARGTQQYPLRKRMSLNSLHRWAGQGSRGAVLRTIRIGGVRHTCARWFDEFIAAQNGLASQPTAAGQTAAAEAGRKLAALGA